MTIVGPALIALAVATAFNLVFSVGYIGRLREVHRAVTEWTARVANSPVMGGPQIGSSAPSFSAPTIDGQVAETAQYSGSPWIVGFFAGSCGSCRTYLPQLCDLLSANRLTSRGLVVIDGREEQAADLIAMVRKRTPVVLEPVAGISSLFKVEVYPTFVLVGSEGVVDFGTNSVEDLRRRLAS
jgi:thiol-disulfide isomerase/thioredoxin